LGFWESEQVENCFVFVGLKLDWSRGCLLLIVHVCFCGKHDCGGTTTAAVSLGKKFVPTKKNKDVLIDFGWRRFQRYLWEFTAAAGETLPLGQNYFYQWLFFFMVTDNVF
jgi:hypothetical protein